MQYDNLGEVLSSEVYDGDGLTLTTTAGVPDRPGTNLLRGKTERAYDELGREYETREYGVDPATGVPGTPLTTRAWFDRTGRVVKLAAPGGRVEKAAYDGVGRVTVTFTTDGGGDSGYADAMGVAGDKVFTQIEYGYDPDGLLLTVTGRDRAWGETGTGPLGTATSGVKARVSDSGYYYDLAGRVTDAVDVGTNGGTGWARPAAVPGRSDAVRVQSVGYDAAGNASTRVDPAGVTTGNAYDMAGRLVSTSLAAGTPLALTTTYGYDGGGHLVTVTAPGDRVTRYGYDGWGRNTAVTERDGTPLARTSTATLDNLGRVASTADPAGLVAAVTRDTVGRAVGVSVAGSTPLARTTSSEYDVFGRVLAATDARGFTSTSSYNDAARTVTAADPYGATTSVARDAAGNVVGVTDPLGKSSTATYDLLGRALTRTDATGRATGYQYLVDATTDRVTQPGGATTAVTLTAFGEAGVVTDPLGHVTSYAYDRVGRAITVTDPRGTPTAATYDALGRVTAVTEAVGHPEQRSTGYGYDAAGDLDSVTDPRGTVTKLARDSAGRVTGVTSAWGTSVALTTGYEYDARDQMTAVVRPGGRRSESGYDLLGQQVSVTEGAGTPLARTTTFGYDAGGNRTTVTDPLNHVTTTAYDKSARPVSITNAVGAVTAVTYDAAGRVQQVTDPVGNVTAYGYDDAGRTLTVTDPRGKVTTTAHDAAGRVLQVTDRLGQRRVFTRDANGQVTSEDWYTTVNAKVETRSYGYDADDNLTSATNSAGGYTLGYDRLNQVTSVAGPTGVDLAMSYDAGGNRTLVADNKGASQSSGYDAQGRLSSRVLNDGATQARAVWNYDAATGNLASLARSESVAGSGAWVSAGSSAWGRDALGRVTSLTTTSGSGATLASYAYGYDAADRMASETINDVTTNYGYDAANQLTRAGNQSFGYDLAGNRAGPGVAVGPGNRVLADGTYNYTYDDAGQLTSKSAISGGASWNYGYDVAGRMTTASQADGGSVAYTFDALGNRVGRSESIGAATSVERYVIDAWDTAKSGSVGTESSDTWADLDGSGAVTSRRLFGPGFDDPVARVDGGSSATSWYSSDGRGSVTAVFDTAGAVAGSRSYAAFGAVTAESGAGLDRYGYTSREWDAVAGLQYSRARMYDPTGGVFTGEDPLGFAAGDPNLRRYVGSGPTNASDPSGMQPPTDAPPERFGSYTLVDPDNPYKNRWTPLFGGSDILGGWSFTPPSGILSDQQLQNTERWALEHTRDKVSDTLFWEEEWSDGEPTRAINRLMELRSRLQKRQSLTRREFFEYDNELKRVMGPVYAARVNANAIQTTGALVSTVDPTPLSGVVEAGGALLSGDRVGAGVAVAGMLVPFGFEKLVYFRRLHRLKAADPEAFAKHMDQYCNTVFSGPGHVPLSADEVAKAEARAAKNVPSIPVARKPMDWQLPINEGGAVNAIGRIGGTEIEVIGNMRRIDNAIHLDGVHFTKNAGGRLGPKQLEEFGRDFLRQHGDGATELVIHPAPRTTGSTAGTGTAPKDITIKLE